MPAKDVDAPGKTLLKTIPRELSLYKARTNYRQVGGFSRCADVSGEMAPADEMGFDAWASMHGPLTKAESDVNESAVRMVLSHS